MGDGNAQNKTVVSKAVPGLLQMLRAPDLAQVDASVSAPLQPPPPLLGHFESAIESCSLLYCTDLLIGTIYW